MNQDAVNKLVTELKNKFRRYSEKKTCEQQSEENGDDYLDVQDWSGGNFDDAFGMGQEDGYIDAAKDVMYLIEQYEKELNNAS